MFKRRKYGFTITGLIFHSRPISTGTHRLIRQPRQDVAATSQIPHRTCRPNERLHRTDCKRQKCSFLIWSGTGDDLWRFCFNGRHEVCDSSILETLLAYCKVPRRTNSGRRFRFQFHSALQLSPRCAWTLQVVSNLHNDLQLDFTPSVSTHPSPTVSLRSTTTSYPRTCQGSFVCTYWAFTSKS